VADEAIRAGGGDVIARAVGGRQCSKIGWWRTTSTSSNKRGQRMTMSDKKDEVRGREQIETNGDALLEFKK
jgi:hypothetical protein